MKEAANNNSEPQALDQISPAACAALESLRTAVKNALDKKRRLGQYAVLWENNAPLLVGENLPDTEGVASQSWAEYYRENDE